MLLSGLYLNEIFAFRALYCLMACRHSGYNYPEIITSFCVSNVDHCQSKHSTIILIHSEACYYISEWYMSHISMACAPQILVSPLNCYTTHLCNSMVTSWLIIKMCSLRIMMSWSLPFLLFSPRYLRQKIPQLRQLAIEAC